MGETTAARRRSGMPKCWRKAEEEGTYIGGPPFVPGEATTRDKRPFCPGSWLHPGQKGGPFVLGRGSTRDKRCFWAGRENSLPAAHL